MIVDVRPHGNGRVRRRSRGSACWGNATSELLYVCPYVARLDACGKFRFHPPNLLFIDCQSIGVALVDIELNVKIQAHPKTVYIGSIPIYRPFTGVRELNHDAYKATIELVVSLCTFFRLQ